MGGLAAGAAGLVGGALLGGRRGGGGGGGRPGVRDVKTSTSPWAGQQPFLKEVFRRAQGLSNRPMQQFPGERVVGFSPETEEALDLTAQRARAGSPLTQSAQQQLQRTLDSDIVSEPQFQRDFSRMARSVAPQITSTFATRGRGRGGGIREAQTRSLGDIFTNLYGQERQRQLGAARMAPALAGLDYADIGRLAQVGGQRESLQQQRMADEIRRFQFQQMEPLDRLQRYASLVAGGSFGSEGTQQIPYMRQPSSFGKDLLGGALGGAQLGSTFGGPWGAGLGALGGGLLSGFG